MIRTSLPPNLETSKSKQKQKDVPPDHHRARKLSGMRWDEPRERQILLNFSRSIGRDPSPTPSAGSGSGRRSKWTAYHLSKLNDGQPEAQDEDDHTANDMKNAASDAPNSTSPQDGAMTVTDEGDQEIATAAILFNRHNPAHPYCQVAVQQLVEQIFSDDHFDAAVAMRTARMAEKLVGFGLDKNKTYVVTADLMESARHAKASRQGRTLVDEMTLHAFLEDVKAGVPDPLIGDTLRKWQRDLEMQMTGVETAEDPSAPPPPQLASPVSIQSSRRSTNEACTAADVQQDVADAVVFDDAEADADAEPDSEADEDGLFVYDSHNRNDGESTFGQDNVADLFTMSGALPDSPSPEPSLNGRAMHDPPLVEHPMPNLSLPVRQKLPTVMVSPPTPQEVQMQDDAEHEAGRLGPRSASTPRNDIAAMHAHRQQRRSAQFSDRFSNPLQVFIYHAHQALGKKCTPKRSKPHITARAEAIWSQLGDVERHDWNRLCLQLQSEDSMPLDSAVGVDLLERQALLDQLKELTEDNHVGQSPQLKAKVDPEPRQGAKRPLEPDEPVQVFDYSQPIPRGPGRKRSGRSRASMSSSRSSTAKGRQKWKKQRQLGTPSGASGQKHRQGTPACSKPITLRCDDESINASRIAFIIGTPDSPIQFIDAVDFVHLCKAKFGDALEPGRCGQLFPHVWSAQFKDPTAAKGLLHDGVSLLHRGVHLTGEAFPQATRLLECCLSSTGITPGEVAYAVVAAFPRESCSLFRFPNDRFVLVFSTPRFIFRLYVPVLSKTGKVKAHVRFQPLGSGDVCRACGIVHADVCPGGARVLLPRIVRSS
ncbi:hypothetical protein M409DRAFT_60330 [Zasmidium cellare ATCC 36951]|uniref:Uncharacterized protein n=1 Tax=Zasmidium cellare ATCC 36951 TaxID=1080233 RepID=A0A6A6BYP1_ZASCE|nr:uncharacterized protein M409DRAFT_60330 [Zasmidium cellare ATCC 36951]KAF2159914.1 hypothetical protein M409DRAFT_60330 [Zasmidium cellare ATCC 36951]